MKSFETNGINYEHRPDKGMKFHYFRNQHFDYGVVKSGIEAKLTATVPVLRGVEIGGLQGQK